LPLSNAPDYVTLGGRVLPTVPLTCSTCGNTHLLNLLILGFTERDFEALTFLPVTPRLSDVS